MKIGFLLDPIDSLKEWKDTSILLMRAAAARGHEVSAIAHESVSLDEGALFLEDLALQVNPTGKDWCKVVKRSAGAWEPGNPIVIRKDPPFDLGYLRCMRILEFASRAGVPVYNNPSAVMRNDEKLMALRYPKFAPKSLVTCDTALIRGFHARLRGCVLKPLGLMGGRGVYLSPEEDINLASVAETLTAGGRDHVIVQESIAAASEGDKRVIVVGGEIQPFMLRRVPAAGDFRGNVDAGATAKAEPVGDAERAVAEAVAPDLEREGVLLAGLDMLGDRLTEINLTSPTCMREIKDQTGHDCSLAFIERLEGCA